MLTMDCLLCLWTTAGLAAAHTALVGGRFRMGWWLLSAAACALGVLTKGPVALVLVLVPTAAYALLDRRSARIGLRGWAAYLAVVAAVAGPWYAAISVAEPDFAVSFFWKHNVVRFVAPFDHAEPVWFHLPPLLLGMLPWSLLLPGFLVFLARRSRRSAARRPAALGFFLLAAVWSLVFFSAAGASGRSTSCRPCRRWPWRWGAILNALVPAGVLPESWGRLWRRGSRLAYRASPCSSWPSGPGRRLLADGHHLVARRPRLTPCCGGAVAATALLVALRIARFRGRFAARRPSRCSSRGCWCCSRRTTGNIRSATACATCRARRLYPSFAIRKGGIR